MRRDGERARVDLHDLAEDVRSRCSHLVRTATARPERDGTGADVILVEPALERLQYCPTLTFEAPLEGSVFCADQYNSFNVLTSS